MFDNIKLAIKNSAIYSIGNLSTKIIGLILLPFYTKHLTISDYGILGILEITSQILIATFGLALYAAFSRWYWDKDFKDKQNSMFFTLIIFLIFISILMFLGVSFFSKQLSILLFDKNDFSYLLKIMAIATGLQIIIRIPATLMKLQQKPILFTTSNIIKLIITLIITIYFVVFLNRKVEGIYEAQIIGLFFYFLVLSKYIWQNIQFKLEIKVLREMLIYSIPLMLSLIAGIILSITDRYCLKFLGGLADVGVYSLGYKMANTIKVFVVTSIQLAISPMIYQMMNKPNNKIFYSKIMTYFSFVVIICILVISSFGKEIIKVLVSNKDYWGAYTIIPIIAFSILFKQMSLTAQIGINIVKKTKILAIIITSISLLNLILNIIFIPYWQSNGAATATLISQFLFFVLIYRYAQKHYFIPYEMIKIIKMIIIGIILFVISLLTNDFNLLFRLSLKIMLVISFPILLYYWNFYEAIELIKLKQIWDKWHNPKMWKQNK